MSPKGLYRVETVCGIKTLMIVADEIEILDPPTEEELDIFRGEMDTQGQFSDARGTWIAREEDRWVMVAEEKGDLVGG